MNKIFMIGNTHFDPVWLWKWDEAMASIRSTFRSALDRMNEDPEFVYSFATPPVFEWIREVDPDMFEEIKLRVTEGRWELAEGWYIQPDCFSAFGESYARQGLYAQRYLKQTFGMYADTVFNIDSFGHNAATPQLLAKSHMKYYCMCRPEQRHVKLPSPYFRWESRDGSAVYAFRAGQNTEIYSKNLDQSLRLSESVIQNSDCDELVVYGVTNHGGAPTKQALADIHNLNNSAPYEVHCSTVREYFVSQSDPKTKWVGELLTGDYGVYTNHHEVKKRNRTAEYAMLNAEKVSVIASKTVGRPYPRDILTSGWKDVLFHQFHDILGGASIREAYTDACHGQGRAIFSAEEQMHYALQSVARRIQTPGKNGENPWNLVVWNLNGTPYRGYIEAEVQWLHEFPAYAGGIVVRDSDGIEYPCQILLARSVIPGFRSRFVFEAEIPAMGYKSFCVVQTGETAERIRNRYYETIHTEKMDVLFDTETGLIQALKSQTTGIKLSDILIPECYEDLGDTWCFNIAHHGEKCEPFCLKKMSVTESGIHRTTIRVEYTFRASCLVMYYTFYENKDYFDVRYTVNWNEPHTVLQLTSHTGCHTRIVSAPFTAEERGDTDADQPMGEWLCMQGDGYGISFIADSLFSYTGHEDVVSLNVLRSCIYGDLRIGELEKDADYPIMEQGITEGHIRVMLHTGTYTDAQIPAAASHFNNSPIVICESNHDGDMPAENSFLSLYAMHTAVSAVKQCEDDDSMIVRLYEYAGQAETVTMTLFGSSLTVTIDPYEIKTLKISHNTAVNVYITEDVFSYCEN